jgi:hypothetical protein
VLAPVIDTDGNLRLEHFLSEQVTSLAQTSRVVGEKDSSTRFRLVLEVMGAGLMRFPSGICSSSYKGVISSK